MEERSPYVNSVNLNAASDFPYLVLHVENDKVDPRNPGFRIMHWHEDLQFVYVTSGDVLVRTLGEDLSLAAGEGAFVNKGVVHQVDRVGECAYSSFLFPERLVSFYPGGPATELTRSVTGDENLPVLKLCGDKAWSQTVLDALRALVRLEEHKDDRLYPYRVLTALSELWLVLLEHVPVEPRAHKRMQDERMRAFLRFVEDHYGEHVALEDIARSADVSVSECQRCFKAALGTTPYRYLMEYRLARAAELLRGTDLPVGEVAVRCGWDMQGYFGRCFRERMGCTPSAYRRRDRPV